MLQERLATDALLCLSIATGYFPAFFLIPNGSAPPLYAAIPSWHHG
jgi:hypothetical protein